MGVRCTKFMLNYCSFQAIEDIVSLTESYSLFTLLYLSIFYPPHPFSRFLFGDLLSSFDYICIILLVLVLVCLGARAPEDSWSVFQSHDHRGNASFDIQWLLKSWRTVVPRKPFGLASKWYLYTMKLTQIEVIFVDPETCLLC